MIRFKHFISEAWDICEGDEVHATLYRTNELVRENGTLKHHTRWWLVPADTLERFELDVPGGLLKDAKAPALERLSHG